MTSAPRHRSAAHRHAAFLAVATTVFFEGGYGGGGAVDAIIASAGGFKESPAVIP